MAHMVSESFSFPMLSPTFNVNHKHPVCAMISFHYKPVHRSVGQYTPAQWSATTFLSEQRGVSQIRVWGGEGGGSKLCLVSVSPCEDAYLNRSYSGSECMEQKQMCHLCKPGQFARMTHLFCEIFAKVAGRDPGVLAQVFKLQTRGRTMSLRRISALTIKRITFNISSSFCT